MKTKAEIDAAILDGARKIQNGGALMGEGYSEIIPALNEHYQTVFQKGGAESAEDFLVHASPERVRVDIVALLMAAGLGGILVQAAGRQDWNPEPDFFTRYAGLIESGMLTKQRGAPNPDPLSAYAHPGVRIHGRASTAPATPDGKVI